MVDLNIVFFFVKISENCRERLERFQNELYLHYHSMISLVGSTVVDGSVVH